MATILPLSHVRTLPFHLHPTYGKTVPTSYDKSVPTISLGHRVLPRVITTRRESTRFRIHSEVKVEELKGLEGFADETSKLRKKFHELLHVRRTPQVPMKVEPAKLRPYQDGPFNEAMQTCPRADIPNLEELLVKESFYLYTESCPDQGKLPVLVVSMKQTTKTKRPTIVFLHGTTLDKEWLYPILEAYASRGYVAVSVDARYHGERGDGSKIYDEAMVASWKTGNTLPFIFDTVWDLMKLADYLTNQRDDVDPDRIGITGISLGGMHAWFAAFADLRYRVVVPIIGVQGYRWAVDNNRWQARVNSIVAAFEAARIDLGKSEIDSEVVAKVWDQIAPGLAEHFDSPYTIPALAPRPLLIINGGIDERNPVEGLDVPVARAQEAYKAHNASEKFKVIIEPGVAHEFTQLMVQETSAWFDKFL